MSDTTGSRCCSATTRAGHRCRKPPIAGGTVCRSHGGAAPQVQVAAKMRAAEQEAHREAARMVARDGVDVDPITHLLDSLHRAAALVEVWGQMAAAIDDRAELEAEQLRGTLSYREDKRLSSPYELEVSSHDRMLVLDRHGQASVHPYVVQYERALDRRAKFAKLAIDAGIAERQVRIAEKQGQQIAQAITHVFEKLGIEITPAVSETIGEELRKLIEPPADPTLN